MVPLLVGIFFAVIILVCPILYNDKQNRLARKAEKVKLIKEAIKEIGEIENGINEYKKKYIK